MGRKSKHEVVASRKAVYRAGIYLRLSREDGDKMESDSIATQRELVRNYIDKQEDIILIDEYVDDGFSGTNFNRPDFRRMEQDWKNGRINCIIVKDLSRFGRDYIDMGNYVERVFPTLDIRFIAINDGHDSLYTVGNDSLMLPVKNVFNGYYAKDIQKKVNSALDCKRTNGEWVGAFTCYGYQKDPQNKHKIIIDEYAARIVRRIFKDYLNGKGQLTIAKELNAEGVLCPSAYKETKGLNYRNSHRLDKTIYWTYATVHRVLVNEMYIGNMVQGKSYRRIMRGKSYAKNKRDWVVVENTHPPIIDKITWEKVKRMFSIDTRQDIVNGMQNNVHIFAGLIVCEDCKRAMSKNKSGNTVYYVCSTNKRYGQCTRHAIKYDVLYEIVLNDLNHCISSIRDLQDKVEKNRPTLKRNADGINLALKRAESELAKVQKRKQKAYEDYQDGLLEKEEYIKYKNEYMEKEIQYQEEVDLLTKECSQAPDAIMKNSAWVTELLKHKRIDKLDRDIVLQMIDKIVVAENNTITISYNFSSELDALFNSQYIIE